MKNDSGTPVTTGLPGKARIRKIEGNFLFTEGPIWHPDQYFLFSDTPANCIYQLLTNGSPQLFLYNSGLTHAYTEELSDQLGSNGLALDNAGNLYICQHGNHAIAVMDRNKETRPLISEFNGIPFNSPNDIILSADGIIYFTDPPYGLAGQVLHAGSFQPHAGIYRYSSDTVELIGTELQYPNGLCFSPDEKYLYVSTNHPAEPYILKYKLTAGGRYRYDSIFVHENADGLKIDKTGNICMAVKEGILIVSPGGQRVAMLAIPGTPTNLAWGPDEKILLVTAGPSLYLIEK